LKTPLTPLQLQVELLQRLPAGNEAGWLEDRVKDAKRQIERLKRLVDELLDVSRIDTGRFRLDLASVDLGGVVRETVVRFRRSGAQRIRIDIHVHSDEPIIGQWDRLRVEQVISNLLDNAVKFGGENVIEVRVSADASEATLAVTDHGIGITPGDQQRIFERFERSSRCCPGASA
jgi:two-component system, OmpR family, sensor kinase